MDFTATGTAAEPLCPLCNTAAGRVCCDYGTTKIIRCHGCGLWRACPRLSPPELAAYYEQHYYSDELQQAGQYDTWRRRHADVWRTNARLVLREARRRGLGHGGAVTVLDVGCGHGFFLEECGALSLPTGGDARGTTSVPLVARGIDTSPQAVKYAAEELKLDVRAMPLDELPAAERYDVITLWGVLEHVPQPLRTMEQVRAHLNPGGMTWVMTPNTNALERFLKGAQYFNFLNRSHLTHFHRGTLRALLLRAGFTNVRRCIHWGGGSRRGPAALAQYAARWLCLGTELRFIAETESASVAPR